MEARDLPAVHVLSAHVHPDYPERAEVLAEKFSLFPRGCFALESGGRIVGYCFSHPWMRGRAVSLDTLLGALPEVATTYYIHDLTLDDSMRGKGHGRAIVPDLLAVAGSLGLAHASLIAVNRRGPFWQASGFAPTADADLQAAVRAKYGTAAVHMERSVQARR